MTRTPKPDAYPDISDILSRKREGRRELSGLTFGEKIARMEKLRERLKPFKRLRQDRQAQTPRPPERS